MPLLQYALLLSVLAGCHHAARHPRLTLEPDPPVLWGDPVKITAEGLEAGQEAQVTAIRGDHNGDLWHAHASFLADETGTIDVDGCASTGGTYAGVDGLALFWSMSPVADTSQAVTIALGHGVTPSPNTAYFSLQVDGHTVARASRSFCIRTPDVSVEEVREEGLAGNLILPADNARRTTVIWLSGSEGGVGGGDYLGSLLASKGYAVLALAYFGVEGLPTELEEIPLEYFERAITWLQTHKEIRNNRLCVVGVSKGSELALLLGSTLSEISAVAAYVPASVVWQGLNRLDWNSVESSWSYGGKPLDFLPYRYTPEFYAQFAQGQPEKLSVFDLYSTALEDSAAVDGSAIPAERVHGDILLLSAEDDQMWPSGRMSEMIVARLEQEHFPHRYRHIEYEGAGHAMVGTGYEPVQHELETSFYILGGTPAATARARAQSWEELQVFLADLSAKDPQRPTFHDGAP